MTDELLPCPFCGGQAEILSGQMSSGCMAYGVLCQECASRGDIYDTEAEAIAAWNTRAEYHGYEQAAIEAWQSIKAFKERTCHIEHVKGGAMYDVWRCSACGYEYAESVSEESIVQNYCPNCGAKVVSE